MKYLVAVAIVGLGLYGLTSAGAKAHHNNQHSISICGQYNPCPQTPNPQKPMRK